MFFLVFAPFENDTKLNPNAHHKIMSFSLTRFNRGRDDFVSFIGDNRQVNNYLSKNRNK